MNVFRCTAVLNPHITTRAPFGTVCAITSKHTRVDTHTHTHKSAFAVAMWVQLGLCVLAVLGSVRSQAFTIVDAYAVATVHGGSQVLVQSGTPLPGTLDPVTLYLELSVGTLDAYLLETFSISTLVPNTDADSGAPLEFSDWAAQVLEGLPNCAAQPGALWRYERWGPRGAPTLVSTCAVMPPGSSGVRAWIPAGVLALRGPDTDAAAAAGVPVGHPVLSLGPAAFNRTGANPGSAPVTFGVAPDLPYPEAGRWPANGTALSVVGTTLVLCAWLPVDLSAAGVADTPRDWDCSVTATAGGVTSAATDGVSTFGTVTGATLKFLPDSLLWPDGNVTVRVAGIPEGAVPPSADPWWSWSWTPGGTTEPVPCVSAGGARVVSGMPPAWLTDPVNVTRGQPWVTIPPAPGAVGTLTATRADGGRVWTWPAPRAVGPLDGPLGVAFQSPLPAAPTNPGNMTLWFLPKANNGTVLGPDADGAFGPFSLPLNPPNGEWNVELALPIWLHQVVPELLGLPPLVWHAILEAPPRSGFASVRQFMFPNAVLSGYDSILENPVVYPDTRLPTRTNPGPGAQFMVLGDISIYTVQQCGGITDGFGEELNYPTWLANADVAASTLDHDYVLRFRGSDAVGGNDIFPEGDAAWWTPMAKINLRITCEMEPVFRVGFPEIISPYFWTVLPRPPVWLTQGILRVHVPRAVTLAFDLTVTGGSNASWEAGAPACIPNSWFTWTRAVLNTTAVSRYPGGAVLDLPCYTQFHTGNMAALRIPTGAFAPKAPLNAGWWLAQFNQEPWGAGPREGTSQWLWFGDGVFPEAPFNMPSNGSVVELGQLLRVCPLVDLAARDNGTTDASGPLPFLTPVCAPGSGLLGTDTTPDAVRGRAITHSGTAFPVTDYLQSVGDRALNATRGAVVLAYADIPATGTGSTGPWWAWDPVPAVASGTAAVVLPHVNSIAYPVACMFRSTMSSRAYGWASPEACTAVNTSAEYATVTATRWDGVRVAYLMPVRTRGHAVMPPPSPPLATSFMYGVSVQPVWRLSICPVRLVLGGTSLDVDCAPYSIVATVDVTPRWLLPRYATSVPPGDYWADVVSVRFSAPNTSYSPSATVVMSTGELLFAVVSMFPLEGPEFRCTQSPPLLSHVFQGMWVGPVVHSYSSGWPDGTGNTNTSANSTVLGYGRVPSNTKGVASVQLFAQGAKCYLRSDGSLQRDDVFTGPSILMMTDPAPAPTSTASATPTSSPSPSGTPTASTSITPTMSITPSRSPTISVTASRSPTISVTPSRTPSATPTISVTPSRTPTISVTPTRTPTISVTRSRTPTTSRTPSVTPSRTPSLTPRSGWLNYAKVAIYLVPMTGPSNAVVVNVLHSARYFLGEVVTDSLGFFNVRIPYRPLVSGASTSWYTAALGYTGTPYALVFDMPRNQLTNATFAVPTTARTDLVNMFRQDALSKGFTVSTSFAGSTSMIPQRVLFIRNGDIANPNIPENFDMDGFINYVIPPATTSNSVFAMRIQGCNMFSVQFPDMLSCLD